jgi:transposase
MPAPRKYPDELRGRALRLVREAMAEDPSLSLNAAHRIGPRLGIVPDTLRNWAKQRRTDDGLAPGTTTADAARIKKGSRSWKPRVCEHKRADEILLAASSFFAGAVRHAAPGRGGGGVLVGRG